MNARKHPRLSKEEIEARVEAVGLDEVRCTYVRLGYFHKEYIFLPATVMTTSHLFQEWSQSSAHSYETVTPVCTHR